MRLLPFLAALPVLAGLSSSAFAVDPTGISECDDFLSKYETCGLEVLAGGAKLQFEKSIIDSAMSFRASAENPEARAQIAKLCSETHAALKTNETPFKICMNQ